MEISIHRNLHVSLYNRAELTFVQFLITINFNENHLSHFVNEIDPVIKKMFMKVIYPMKLHQEELDQFFEPHRLIGLTCGKYMILGGVKLSEIIEKCGYIISYNRADIYTLAQYLNGIFSYKLGDYGYESIVLSDSKVSVKCYKGEL